LVGFVNQNKVDKQEREHIVEQKLIVPPGAISVGVTWIDGRIIFRHDKKWSRCFFGVCHFPKGVFAITPLDWDKTTMITTIEVEPTHQYCERAHTCLDFKCPLNRFDKKAFIAEFKDMGAFTLGLPQNLGREPMWFSVGKWQNFWGKLCLVPEGGVLRYKEE